MLHWRGKNRKRGKSVRIMKSGAFWSNGFSLMEMMVVLLIVAIIAAASAPMVTKKMSRNAGTGDSPWVYTGLSNNIAYNINGGNSTAIIGSSRYDKGDNGPANPRLVLASGANADQSALAFADQNGKFSGQINMNSTTRVVTMNDALVGNDSVAIGLGQTTIGNSKRNTMIGAVSQSRSNDSTTVGYHSIAYNIYGTAIGSLARATGYASVALGYNAQAGSGDWNYSNNNGFTTNPTNGEGDASVAVGLRAEAKGSNSIAIGNKALATTGLYDTGYKKFYDSSVAIGKEAKARDYGAIAIGPEARTKEGESDCSIAIGHQADADAHYAVAIGKRAFARESAVAIGDGAHAGKNSVAIGNGAQTTYENTIVLGRKEDTVYIPGNLVVMGSTMLGGDMDRNPKTRIREAQTSSKNCIIEIYRTYDDGKQIGSNKDHHGFAKVGPYNFSSDRRLKNVGKVYTAGLEELKKLEFFHYTFKKDEAKTPRVGVMAQDLEKVFPDAVTKGDDGFLRIRWEDMFYAVINAVKELDTKISAIVKDVAGVQETIKAQQAQIDELEKQNAELEKRIEKLEKALKKEKKD